MSSFTTASLLPGEQLLYRTTLHWATLIPWPILFLILAIVFRAVNVGLELLAWVCVALAVLAAAVQWLRYTYSEFALTNRRLLIKTGWISRTSTELLLSKLESMAVRQDLADRVFGSGTVVIVGTGGSQHVYRGIADPLELRRHVPAQPASRQEGPA